MTSIESELSEMCDCLKLTFTREGQQEGRCRVSGVRCQEKAGRRGTDENCVPRHNLRPSFRYLRYVLHLAARHYTLQLCPPTLQVEWYAGSASRLNHAAIARNFVFCASRSSTSGCAWTDFCIASLAALPATTRPFRWKARPIDPREADTPWYAYRWRAVPLQNFQHE